jgi:hypothetical protein
MSDLILGAIIGAGGLVLGTLIGLVPTFLAHRREKGSSKWSGQFT